MKNNISITFALSAVFALVVCSLFFWMLLSVTDRAERTALIVQQIEEVNRKKNHMRVLTNMLSESEEEQKELEALFVQDGEIVNLLQAVEQLGTYAGTIVEVGSIQDEGSQIFISLSAPGSFTQLRHFLALVENIPQAVAIKSVRLSKQRRTTLWSIGIELIIFKNNT